MIKVLHFVSTPAIWSGVMSVIMNYYRHMDRSKIQFDFLCFLPCEESYEEEIEALGGRVFFIPKPGVALYKFRELEKFFSEHGSEYTWLHNHEIYLTFLLKPTAAHYGINHFIVHSHTTKYSDRKLSAFRNRILCIPIRFMNCEKFACSQSAGKFLFGNKAAVRNKFQVLHNAIDFGKYSFNQETRRVLRKKYGLENCYVIGHVGRFVPQKNHQFIIAVFSEVAKHNPHARLVLIGDGPLKDGLVENCHKKGLNQLVLFLGHRDDVESFLNMMDVFVLPSTFEGIGIALLEAQANGLAGIASNYVPGEVNITDNIHFLPLERDLWVGELNNHQKNRMTRPDIIEVEDTFLRNHYEIETEVRRLQEYYENTDPYVHI